jgi:hypothetical protein
MKAASKQKKTEKKYFKGSKLKIFILGQKKLVLLQMKKKDKKNNEEEMS